MRNANFMLASAIALLFGAMFAYVATTPATNTQWAGYVLCIAIVAYATFLGAGMALSLWDKLYPPEPLKPCSMTPRRVIDDLANAKPGTPRHNRARAWMRTYIIQILERCQAEDLHTELVMKELRLALYPLFQHIDWPPTVIRSLSGDYIPVAGGMEWINFISPKLVVWNDPEISAARHNGTKFGIADYTANTYSRLVRVYGLKRIPSDDKIVYTEGPGVDPEPVTTGERT